MSKTVFIKVRVTPEEKRAYLAAACAAGKSLSEIIRDRLDQLYAEAKQ
jgi:predicted HicB family RNase H-like nuclease